MSLGFKQLSPLNEAMLELATKKTGGSAGSKGRHFRASRAVEKPDTATEATEAPALAAPSTRALEEPRETPPQSIGYRIAN